MFYYFLCLKKKPFDYIISIKQLKKEYSHSNTFSVHNRQKYDCPYTGFSGVKIIHSCIKGKSKVFVNKISDLYNFKKKKFLNFQKVQLYPCRTRQRFSRLCVLFNQLGFKILKDREICFFIFFHFGILTDYSSSLNSVREFQKCIYGVTIYKVTYVAK